MHRKLVLVALVVALVGGFAFAQDLTIDYQYNTRRYDPANHFTFSGPIRYVAADGDTVDTTTGASKLGSTHVFQPYRVDVLGNKVMPATLRGLFLYAVNTPEPAEEDNLTVDKDRNGVITIQYSHRGTAYKIVTDRNGVISLPDANCVSRKIGFIQGGGPQVIASDFSRNNTAGRIDWAKVWDPSIPGGRTVQAGNDAKTGDIGPDVAASDSMFFWQGNLQVSFDNNILKINGGLNAVAR